MITIERTSSKTANLYLDSYKVGTIDAAWPTLLDRLEEQLAGCDPELVRKLDDALIKIEDLKEDLRNALDRV